MFALLISIPRFKSNIYHQNSPKIKLFLQKNAKFRALEALLPDLQPSVAGGLARGPLMALAAPLPDSQNSFPHWEFLATNV